MNNLEEQIFELCAKTFKADKTQLTLKSSFTNDLGADSLDLVEFALTLEDTFKIEVPESQIQDIQTIGDVISLLKRHMN